VLEVGCGRGDFLAALTKRCGCETEGLELNPAAVAAATAFGRQVAQRDVVEHAAARPGNYDAVCAFQVLEHVPKTRAFLEALVTLVRPGGRLILGVPDHDNYLGRGEDLVLDMPPHHCTRWRAGVFRALERLLPVRVERVVHEPLQAQHVDCYLSILNDSDRRAGRSGAWRRKLRRRVVGPVLTHSRAARWLVRGHTLYARLRRLG
jgi:SAM-dependent methyltransferase